MLLTFLLTRTTWRPAAPLRLARRRAWGQVLSASWRMYTGRIWLFLGLGLVALPVSVIVTLLQAGLLRGSSFLGIPTEGEGGGVAVYVGVVVGTALSLAGLGIVQAATARVLVEIDQDRPISVARAYRLAIESLRPLLGAVLVVAFVVSLLATTVVLVPVAIWLAVRWALTAPSWPWSAASVLMRLAAARASFALAGSRWARSSLSGRPWLCLPDRSSGRC